MKRATFSDFLRRDLRIRLTVPQSVWVRVCFDGVDPVDFRGAERDIAARLFRCERIPADARATIASIKGARVGFTWLCSLYLLFAALTADLSRLAPGEQAFAVIVAPDLRLARQALRYVQGAIALCASSMVTGESSDSVTLRRPDGAVVTVECLPASRGGSATRGRSVVAALMDESSFFRDDSAVVNDIEIFRSLQPRIILGGKLCIVSTAWADTGLLVELVGKNLSAPTTAIASICPTLEMRPDDRALRRVIDQESARDPENSRREFFCESLTGGATTYFDPASITAAIDGSLVLPAPRAGRVEVGADFGFVKDSSALVAVSLDGGLYQVIAIEERRPDKGTPLKPSVVAEAFGAIAEGLGVSSLIADSHYKLAMAEHLAKSHLHLQGIPEGQAGKLEMYSTLKSVLNEGRIVLPDHPRLIVQLRQVVGRPTSGGGMVISSPRKAGQGHGDLVSALAAAVHRLSKHRGFAEMGGAIHGVSERAWGIHGAGVNVRLPGGRIKRFGAYKKPSRV